MIIEKLLTVAYLSDQIKNVKSDELEELQFCQNFQQSSHAAKISLEQETISMVSSNNIHLNQSYDSCFYEMSIQSSSIEESSSSMPKNSSFSLESFSSSTSFNEFKASSIKSNYDMNSLENGTFFKVNLFLK